MNEYFINEEDIISLFEQNKSFKEEQPKQSIARFEWALTRFRALSFILSREIGIDSETAAIMSRVNSSLLYGLRDLFYEGIEFEDEEIELHPMDKVINELVTTASEPEDYYEAVELFEVSMVRLSDFASASDEDLIHYLQNLEPPMIEIE